MLKRVHRRLLLALTALLMVLSVSAFPLSSSASAKTLNEMNVSEASGAMGYYYALRTCVRRAIAASEFNQESLNKQAYFGDERVILGGQFISNDGNWDGYDNCNPTKDKSPGEDSGWVRDAITTLGYSDARDFLCHVMNSSNSTAYDSCRTGQGSLSTYGFVKKTQDEREAAFSASVGKRVFGTTEPLNTTRANIVMQNILYNTFYKLCQPTDYSGGTIGSDLKQLAVKQYQASSNSYVDKQVLVKTSRLSQRTGIIEANPAGMNRELSCSEMPANISRFADLATADLSNVPSSFLSNINNPNVPAGETSKPGQTTCVIDGVGWIVCGMSKWLAQVMDGVYGLLTLYLTTPSVNTDIKNEANTLYRVWSVMRNIANVAFVIAFLIIIYSQLTGMGINNYGIKKIMPRLIVAAVLVNASYWITAIAVDLSNITGSGIYNLIRGISHNLGGITIASNAWEISLTALLAGGSVAVTGGAIAATAAAVGAGVVTGGTLAMAALWIAIPAVLTGLLAVVIAFAILAARQALIIILIILAPLAFVALLLPNTESMFKAWRKTLMTMLVFYPIFSIIFAGSQMASMIILSTAGGGSGDVFTGKPVGHIVVLALFIQVIPLILAPMLVKFSGGLIGQLASMVNNKSKGLIDRSRKVRDRKVGLARDEVMSNAARTGGRNPFARTARFMGRAYRRTQNDTHVDADRQKVLDSQNQAAYLETGRAAELSTDLKNAQQQVQTLEAEHNFEFEVQKDVDLTYRLNLANQQIEATKLQDQKDYKETLSTASNISGHPMQNLIQDARDADQTLKVTRDAISSADRVLNQEYAEELQNRPQLANLAGGIDPYGATRARSTAKSTVVQAFNDAVKAEKVTMSSMDASQLSAIMRDASQSEERRSAAAGMIPKVGTADDIMNTFDYMGSLGSDPAKQSIQQQFSADLGGRKPTSVGAGAMSNLELGRFADSFDNLTKGRIEGGKLTGAALAGTPVEELTRMSTYASVNKASLSAAARDAVRKQIEDYLTSPQLEGQRPSPEIMKAMQDLSNNLK